MHARTYPNIKRGFLQTLAHDIHATFACTCTTGFPCVKGYGFASQKVGVLPNSMFKFGAVCETLTAKC